MNVPNQEDAQASPGDKEVTLFRLYVADETPNSARARTNLRSIGKEHLQDRYRTEVVDILQDPLRALSEGVLVTPTLVRLAPLPVRTIVGDLSELTAVLLALGLAGGTE
jgi:circadian clock protein KaiB